MGLAKLSVVVTLLVASSAARASLPVSGAALGQLEAVLEFCGRDHPAASARYQQLAKALLGGATEDELQEARSSAEYQEAHDQASERLADLPQAASEKACLEGPQPAAR